MCIFLPLWVILKPAEAAGGHVLSIQASKSCPISIPFKWSDHGFDYPWILAPIGSGGSENRSLLIARPHLYFSHLTLNSVFTAVAKVDLQTGALNYEMVQTSVGVLQNRWRNTSEDSFQSMYNGANDLPNSGSSLFWKMYKSFIIKEEGQNYYFLKWKSSFLFFFSLTNANGQMHL